MTPLSGCSVFLSSVRNGVNGVTGFFSIIYVPSKLFVTGNAAATACNIQPWEVAA
jgi:hypothetical protein